MNSKSAMYAYIKGYRVVNNDVISPFSGKPMVLRISYHYPQFNISYEGKQVTVKAHQLAAWQKYGRKCIGEGVIIRHKDDNRHNLDPKNILLGTMSQNYKERIKNRLKREKQLKEKK